MSEPKYMIQCRPNESHFWSLVYTGTEEGVLNYPYKSEEYNYRIFELIPRKIETKKVII